MSCILNIDKEAGYLCHNSLNYFDSQLFEKSGMYIEPLYCQINHIFSQRYKNNRRTTSARAGVSAQAASKQKV